MGTPTNPMFSRKAVGSEIWFRSFPGLSHNPQAPTVRSYPECQGNDIARNVDSGLQGVGLQRASRSGKMAFYCKTVHWFAPGEYSFLNLVPFPPF